MPNSTDQANSSSPTSDVVLTWTVHLARKHPLKSAVALAMIALASCAGYYAMGALASIVVGVVMVAALADFLFPMKFILTRESAACRMLFKSSEIKWDNVARCYLDDTGVKLSPLNRQSRLEAFRGVYLRFDHNRQQVIDAVKSLRRTSCLE